MKAHQLKNAILQLAVQGKLVPQNPNDEPASKLLKRIAAEKRRRIKAGEIKKDKRDSTIVRRGASFYEIANTTERCIDDELPFVIPESWEWVRLERIFVIEMGQSPAGNTVSRNCTGTEFHQGKVFFGEKYIKASDQYTTSPTKFAPENSVLLCVRAPVGKVNITDRELCIGRGLCAIIPLAGMPLLFAYYLLATYENIFVKQATGTTFVAITAETVKKQLIPIPPLAEQRRIVDRLESLLPLVEAYGKAEAELSQLDAQFPDMLKKSILQDAVQGKLVPQNPNDEPAEALLKRIRAEKQRLIKEGKIKKDKHESVIFRRDNSHYEKLNGIERCIDDEIPFEIPDNWEWCRLYSIVKKDIKRGKSPKYSECGQNLVFSQKCNTKHGTINLLLAKYLDEVTFTKYPTEEYLTNNDIIINSTGHGTLGRVGFFCGNDRISNAIIVPDSHITIIRCFETVTNKYIFYILKFYQPFLEKLGEGSTNQTELKPATIANLLIPMPPSNEQHKIVEKIEASLQFCKKL